MSFLAMTQNNKPMLTTEKKKKNLKLTLLK